MGSEANISVDKQRNKKEALIRYLRKLEERITVLERAINSPEVVTQADIDALSMDGAVISQKNASTSTNSSATISFDPQIEWTEYKGPDGEFHRNGCPALDGHPVCRCKGNQRLGRHRQPKGADKQ